MIVANNFIIPDECPEDCLFKDDLKYGQNSICIRCPVLCCKEPKTKEEEPYMPIIDKKEYRVDWAAEWEAFFKTKKIPKLKIFHDSEENELKTNS